MFDPTYVQPGRCGMLIHLLTPHPHALPGSCFKKHMRLLRTAKECETYETVMQDGELVFQVADPDRC